MNSIRLHTKRPVSPLNVGSSKLFGDPDVWEGFVWPTVTSDGEEFDLTFMCQINCADAVAFDRDGKLPEKGMLYFFYDLDEMPWLPDDPSVCRVIYYDGDISELHPMTVVDEEGEPCSFSELEITFEEVEEGFLSDCDSTHLLLGRPSLDYGTSYPETENREMLLQIDSLETEDAFINFTDEGVLCFYIEPEKLEKLDFSDVRIMQIYS